MDWLSFCLSGRQGHSFLGVVTNNQAEYDGLIKGLNAAKEAGIKNLKVYGDSKLVIEQMKVYNILSLLFA